MFKKGKKVKKSLKNIIINIIHILTLLLNIFILIIFLDRRRRVEDKNDLLLLTTISCLFLSILNRFVFLFDNEIKKVTLYSDCVLLFSLFQYDQFETKFPLKIFYLCNLLFPIGYSIYTKLLKK